MTQDLKVCRVVSPATLAGGSTFEAEVDGKTFSVTVPEGGIGEGDDFIVPYPKDDAVDPTSIPIAVAAVAEPILVNSMTNNNTNNSVATAFVVPTGRWRYELCDCCSACCCPCLMGWCCYPILMAQVMERMKFNFFGCPNETGNQPPVCITYTIITLVFYVFGLIFMYTTQWGYVLWIIWCFYMLLVFTISRNTIRKKYNIEPICPCGDNELDDCCSVYWCACCTAIQLARHTHDNVQYEYDMFSVTGLPKNAPEIV